MNKTVFISGPIQGMEDEQGYREVVTKICIRLGLDAIDPWLREKIIYNKEEPCWWNKVPTQSFIQRDLDDADRCDVMVVYLPKLSAGACMELFYAKRKGKKVIIVSDITCLSPWIVAHSDLIVKSLAELEDALKKIFS
jgi:nucleoside 2-deoxyribosyltransferase